MHRCPWLLFFVWQKTSFSQPHLCTLPLLTVQMSDPNPAESDDLQSHFESQHWFVLEEKYTHPCTYQDYMSYEMFCFVFSLSRTNQEKLIVYGTRSFCWSWSSSLMFDCDSIKHHLSLQFKNWKLWCYFNNWLFRLFIIHISFLLTSPW